MAAKWWKYEAANTRSDRRELRGAVVLALLETSNYVRWGAGFDRCGLEARSSAEAPPALPDKKIPERCFRSQGLWLIRFVA